MEWREVDSEVLYLIGALKNQVPTSQYYLVASRSIALDSNTSSRHETPLDLVSRRLHRAMKSAGYEGATVIPIPSTRHVSPGTDFPSWRIARAIEARDSNFICRPLLHFARTVPQSSASRRRTETALRVNLRATELPPQQRVILLDDVMTSGAHLKAAATFLTERGAFVEDAFVVARLATICPENMFRVPVFEL